MSDREHVHQAIAGLWDFGRIVGSKVSPDRSTVWIDIEEVGEVMKAQELWGSWAILTRPAAPDATGERAGEVMYIRRGDELVGVACRDTRWQVADIEPGETILRALGPSAAMIRMKPDGTLQIAGVGDFVALASKTLTELTAIVTNFNGHSHTATLAVATTGTATAQTGTAVGTTAGPLPQMTAPNPVASALAKIGG